MNKRILSLFLTLILLLGSFAYAEPTAVLDVVNTIPSEEISITQTDENITDYGGYLTISEDDLDLTERIAKGYNGVVSSANPIASKVGLEVLKKGGNAVDAAVAVSFALGLVEPGASGIGGSGFMMVHSDDDQKTVVYDYMETATDNMDELFYSKIYKRKDVNATTGKGASVPGAVDGWLKALDNYGTMEISELLEPVIQVAEQGFEIPPHLFDVFQDSYTKLIVNEEASRIFTNELLPYETGELFKNPDYANTLKAIAKEGRDGFYKGEIANAIVDTVQAEGGYITLENLSDYSTKVRRPIETTYRGYNVVSTPPTSSGGVAILESLNMLENYDVPNMKHNGVEHLSLLSEVLRLAHADRFFYVGDPDFFEIPTSTLISKTYAKNRINNISTEYASGDTNPGLIEYESPSTTHLVIIDKDGNAVSATNTVGTYFGSTIVPEGTGFVLNDHTFNFSNKTYRANRPEPGKRPRSTMSPTMVFKDDKVYMAMGTPGGSRIPAANIQVISNVLDFNMSIQEAIEQPRVQQMNKTRLELEGGIEAETIYGLIDLGHKVELMGENDSYFGGVQGAIVDPETGEMTGGADARRDGKAVAY